jgi:phasin
MSCCCATFGRRSNEPQSFARRSESRVAFCHPPRRNAVANLGYTSLEKVFAMNSAKNGIPNFEVPPELRAMTEKSMEQARVAFNTLMTSAQQALSHFEGQAKAMQASAKDVSEKAMNFAERNVANTFAFADRLVHAKDVQQVVALQTEFIQTQMKELTEQAKELGEAAAKIAMKSVPPKS